jgi:phage repressor protein C with HTH and peptisase S24 domain
MLTHPQIWRAIDALAARNGHSPSGLARAAGLDPTTFNKSKRGGDGGKLRWPSTESLAKVLAATGTSMGDFVALVGETNASRKVPMIGLEQAGDAGLFDAAGFPAGSGWEESAFPERPDPQCYALNISGDILLPVFRDGDRILVSPSIPPQRGDRVVVKTLASEVMVMELARMTAQRIELKGFSPASQERSFARDELAFIHRIIWASQ